MYCGCARRKKSDGAIIPPSESGGKKGNKTPEGGLLTVGFDTAAAPRNARAIELSHAGCKNNE